MTLATDETRHARDVLRLHPGDEIYVFDGEGCEYQCVIAEITRASTRVDVIAEVEPAGNASHLHLTLALALTKGEKFDLAVQKATELGVSRVIPVVSERADVRLRDAVDAGRRVARWQRIALEAAKQCGRARLMEITEPVAFDSLIASPAEDGERRLMFTERGGTSTEVFSVSSQSGPSKVLAVIGPEGGWTDEEIELAGEGGWKIVTLGGRTLRAETAAIVIATLLQHRFGDLA